MSTALYRRYRPDTFADVIGQEHVTTPLMTALSKDRVNHAYLFSGPRGCGKTTSARILARCLNCQQGPTATPCGACPSCQDLATGGPGSLDVIEIDAASHGGVDDARDLRERATFAPTRDRYKIFIIDEAHMVTSAGFNALLKIVEEPPPHIKFIFATTEPDKVIGTIRSRTHHYPFRLVPPETLTAYLERLCAQEGVPVAPGVLPLVLRAGGGSVRDTLSVLDQLIAGAGPQGLDYELAVSLLGYTHANLLDDVVDALAANDAATVFGVVDRVVQTGHDPRRFVDDLLERFRDLIIVKAMPDSASQIIRGLPADQLARMQQQAATLDAAALSRSADVTNQALTDMTGATSPRLHLELLCARLLLPTGSGTSGYDAGAPGSIPAHQGGGVAGASSSLPGSLDSGSGAASVREALRAAKARQSGGDASESPQSPSPAPAADAQQSVPAPAAPVVPAAAATPAAPVSAPQHEAPQDDAPQTDQARSSAPVPAAEPAATQPSVQQTSSSSSADWGDTWAAVPEPTPQKTTPTAAPAPTDATDPAATPTQPSQPGANPASGPSGQSTDSSAPAKQPSASPAAHPEATPAPNAPAASAAPGGTGSVEMFRRAWPEILKIVATERRAVQINLQQNASVSGFDGRTLTVSFANPGALAHFTSKPDNTALLAWAINQALGQQVHVDVAAGGSADAGGSSPKAERRPAPAPTPRTEPARVEPAREVPVFKPAPQIQEHYERPSAPEWSDFPPASDEQPRGNTPSPTAQSSERDPSAPIAPVSEPEQPQQAPAPASAEPEPATPEPALEPAANPAPAHSPAENSGPGSEPAAAWAEPNDGWIPSDEPPMEEEPPFYGDPYADSYAEDPYRNESFGAPGDAGESSQARAASGKPSAPATDAASAASPAATVETPAAVAPMPTIPSAPKGPTPPPPSWAGTGIPGGLREDPKPSTQAAPAQGPAQGQRLSRYQQLLAQGGTGNGAAAAPASSSASRPVDSSYAEAPARPATPMAPEDFVPSDEDIAIEDSSVIGRAAIERILNGRLIEERNHDGTPVN